MPVLEAHDLVDDALGDLGDGPVLVPRERVQEAVAPEFLSVATALDKSVRVAEQRLTRLEDERRVMEVWLVEHPEEGPGLANRRRPVGADQDR
jgi:hypothetical protein